jgi:hypothetical protein
MIITGASVTDGTAQPCVGAAEGFRVQYEVVREPL